MSCFHRCLHASKTFLPSTDLRIFKGRRRRSTKSIGPVAFSASSRSFSYLLSAKVSHDRKVNRQSCHCEISSSWFVGENTSGCFSTSLALPKPGLSLSLSPLSAVLLPPPLQLLIGLSSQPKLAKFQDHSFPPFLSFTFLLLFSSPSFHLFRPSKAFHQRPLTSSSPGYLYRAVYRAPRAAPLP